MQTMSNYSTLYSLIRPLNYISAACFYFKISYFKLMQRLILVDSCHVFFKFEEKNNNRQTSDAFIQSGQGLLKKVNFITNRVEGYVSG